jgi:hypothetical protein
MAKFRPDNAASHAADLLVLYIPSHDRDGNQIDQGEWVDKALDLLGTTFHGATAFPKARGVWRDDERGGNLVFDEPVIIQCYTSLKLLNSEWQKLSEFLTDMGRQTRQGAVGFVVNSEFFEIPFPVN